MKIKKTKGSSRRKSGPILVISIILCFCASFYVTYYKLVLQDDWAGFFYDLSLGLFTGIGAALVIYFLTIVPREKDDDPDKEEDN